MKYGKSPPDEGDNQETLEASGPLWQAVARLIDDEESAHDMHPAHPVGALVRPRKLRGQEFPSGLLRHQTGASS